MERWTRVTSCILHYLTDQRKACAFPGALTSCSGFLLETACVLEPSWVVELRPTVP
jgi:hypothetical protein